MSSIDEIMEQAQVFASGWALVGSRFDDGSGMDDAEESKASLRDMIAAELANARREGAEQMRAGFVARMRDQRPVAWVRYQSDGGIQGPLLDAQVDGARREFWTPLIAADWVNRSMPTDKRHAVLLTDAAIAEAFLSRCPAHLRGEHDVRDMQARPDVMAMGRAVEAAALAANNLEVRRG